MKGLRSMLLWLLTFSSVLSFSSSSTTPPRTTTLTPPRTTIPGSCVHQGKVYANGRWNGIYSQIILVISNSVMSNIRLCQRCLSPLFALLYICNLTPFMSVSLILKFRLCQHK